MAESESSSPRSSSSKRSEGKGAIGKKFGKYEIVRVLGKGGMGKVFLGVDRDLKRTVAIKMLSKEKAENPILKKRFKAEGQAAANLNHENIVRVFDSGEINGQLYLALEYVEGKDAHQMLSSRGRFPVKRSIEIVAKVAAALEHASKHGIVHRDIKPSNVMIRQDGEIKLADMGLARSLDEDEDAGITRAGTTVGTVDYMSPEQARDSKSADVRSDLYSLGATWYQLITGEPPFPDGDLTNKLRAHATAKRPDPAQLNDSVPEAISSVIARMMAIKPEDRYQTVRDFLEDLDSATKTRSAVLDAVLGEAGDSLPPMVDLPDESEWDDAGDGQASKRGPGKKRKRSRTAEGRSADRDSVTADDWEEDPLSPAKSRDPNASDKAARSKSRRRKAETAKEVAGKDGGPKKRALPPRQQSDDQVRESRRLDPDLIRNVVIGTGIVGIFGAIVWFISSQSGQGGPADPTVGNPYAVDENNQNSLLNAVKGDDPAEIDPAVDQGDDATPPEATIVSATDGLTSEQIALLEKLGPLAPRSGTEIPDWVDLERLPFDETSTTIRVVDGENGGGTYSSLAEAIARTPVEGGQIILTDVGPHRVSTTQIRNISNLAITKAPDGPRPVVELIATTAGEPVLDLAQSNLRLEAIDLFFQGAGAKLGRQTWVSVDSARLTVLDCSINDISGSTESTAFEVTSGRVPSAISRQFPGRTLIAGSSFRGPSLTALHLAAGTYDAVVGNSYLDAGSRPAITVLSRSSGGRRPTSRAVESKRHLLVVGATLFSDQSILAIANSTKNVPTATLCRFEQSMLAGSNQQQPMIAITGWPKAATEGPEGLRVSLPRSTVLRWPELISWSGPSGTVSAKAPADWRNVFPDSSVQSNQQSDAAVQPIAKLVVPEDIRDRPGQWRSLVAKRVGTDLLQADLSRVGWPSEGFGVRYDHRRGTAPAVDLRAPVFNAVGRPLTFDTTKKRPLKAFLESDEAPDGSVVVISGGGPIEVSGIDLGAKRIRLVVDQSNGEIKFRLRAGRRKSPPAFQVSGGRLELVNAILELPPTANTTPPETLFEANGGVIALRKSRVIDAEKTRPDSSLFRATSPDTRVYVTDSILTGPGTIVSGGSNIRLAALNSAFVAGSAVGDGDVSLMFEHCTLRSSGDLLSAGASANATVWAERSVIAPGNAVVSAQDAAVLRSVNWYGNENVFISGAIASQRGTTSGSRLSADSWSQLWGPGHVGRVRVGDVGKLGADRSPLELSRSDFELPSASGLSIPVSTGRPPGVDTMSVGPDVKAARKSPTSPGARPGSPLLPF